MKLNLEIMKKGILSLGILCIVLVTSCKNLNDNEEPFVGEWEYFSKKGDFDVPMLSYVDKTNLILDETGQWKLGKGIGKWGKKKGSENWIDNKISPSYLNLNFAEYEIPCSHADQFKSLEAYIFKINNIDVLNLRLIYTYEDYGSFSGDATTSDHIGLKQYEEKINYYFIKKGSPSGNKKSVLDYLIASKILSNNSDKLSEVVPDSLTISSSAVSDSLAKTSSMSNDAEVSGSAEVVVERTYFYKESSLTGKRKAFLVQGDKVDIIKSENDFIYAVFENNNGKSTTGWLLKSDFNVNQ